MLNNKQVLITGGTGSLGKALIKNILKKFPKIKRLVVYSRDELKQHELQQKYPVSKYKSLRFFLGDVRDAKRLSIALKNIDIVIHAAALKQVPASEYNPTEFIDTNIIGARNILDQSYHNDVKQIIALSTDKAAAPVNLYGATKLCSDKLFVSANQFYGYKFKSSVVRYGNVINSRGSVLPIFKSQKNKKYLTITHKEMTRFNISLDEGVNTIFYAIKNSKGGEIFVPKLSSYKVVDLAKAVSPECKFKFIGIRSGEKIHEEMITTSDAITALDLGKMYVILPSNGKYNFNNYDKKKKFKKLKLGFRYSSDTNNKFLSIKELKKIISKY